MCVSRVLCRWVCVCVWDFDLHFFLLGLHIVPLQQQALNETSRSFPEKDAHHATTQEHRVERNHTRGALAHNRAKTHTFITHDPRRYASTSLLASLCLFITSGESRVNQLFFDWFDLALIVSSKAHISAARSINGLHFMQQQPSSPCSPSSPQVPCSLCLHAPLPPSTLALQLCRSDVWYINGTCAE